MLMLAVVMLLPFVKIIAHLPHPWLWRKRWCVWSRAFLSVPDRPGAQERGFPVGWFQWEVNSFGFWQAVR
jgi:hypothetical protein